MQLDHATMPVPDWPDPLLLAALLVAATALAALVTALVAWRSAVQSRRAADAIESAARATRDGVLSVNMSIVMDEYRGTAMKQALEIIARGARQEGRSFAGKFTARELGEVSWPAADNARRLIYWHYRKCYELAGAGLLPDGFMSGFVQPSEGYGLFMHVVAAMSPDRATGASRERWIAAMAERWPPTFDASSVFRQPMAA